MDTNNGTMKQIGFWAVIIISIAAVVAGMIWLVSVQNKPAVQSDVTIENIITADDWVKGSRNAKVTLIEYGDYQCPACASYSSFVNQLSTDFGADLAVVFRHFPLPQHKNAVPMIYAAEAAGRQGKFWEMSDLIYQNQNKWEFQSSVTNAVTEYAKTLGLNVDQFSKDMASADLKKKADEQILKNQNLDVISYTPTFFLNGKRISPKSYEEFKALITTAVTEANRGTSNTSQTNENQ